MRFSVCRRYSWVFRPVPPSLAALLHKIAATFRFGPRDHGLHGPHLASSGLLESGRRDLAMSSGLTKDQAEAWLDWLENHGQRGVVVYDPGSGFGVRRG